MSIYFIRLICAAIMGFVIGKASNQSPTARTFAIICTGAALITILSGEFIKNVTLPWIGDPARLTAQVISALGFIGTGLIWISEENKTEELSIAAGLWVTAILGIFLGAGLHVMALFTLVFLVCLLHLSKMLEEWKRNRYLK